MGSQRDPYFVQIGFDFGTSYSKCICRDVFKDKAWVCIDEDNDSLQPFLIPSNVIYVDGRFIRQRNTDVCYLADCLPNLKLALIKIAKSELQDPVLTPYAKALGSGDGSRLQELVECGSIFFLASAISDVLKDIKSRFPKFSSHPEDYLALNLAVPVSSEGQAEVNGMFRHVLFKAWHLSEIMSSESQLSIREIRKLMENFGGTRTIVEMGSVSFTRKSAPTSKASLDRAHQVKASTFSRTRERVRSTKPFSYLFGMKQVTSLPTLVRTYSRTDPVW